MFFGVSEEKIKKWTQKGKVNKVIRATEDSKPNIRKAAISALGEIDHEDSFNTLVSTLRDPNPEIRGLAAESLGIQGNPLAVEHLRHISANDEDEKVREIALEAFKKVDVPLEENGM